MKNYLTDKKAMDIPWVESPFFYKILEQCDYTDLEKEDREQRWMVLAYCIEQKKITDIGLLFERNPFFFDWYKRNVISEVPIEETYH